MTNDETKDIITQNQNTIHTLLSVLWQFHLGTKACNNGLERK